MNQGKGAATRTGILASRGRLLLVCDADGAFVIDGERALREVIELWADVAIGSREASSAKRLWYRSLSGKAFACLAKRLVGLQIVDTQCGFKMFRRETALRLCSLCHDRGYLFDIEMLAWAQRLGYRIAEVPVVYRDVPGSKVRLLRDGASMLWGLFILRRTMRCQTPSTRAACGYTGQLLSRVEESRSL
jgi:dolichyl-phosphate beta-glucosyltransferase